MDIIVIIIGIVFLVKRHRLKSMPPNRFPMVADEEFDKWKQLELRRLAVFLWIVWVWNALWLAFEIIVLIPMIISSREFPGLMLLGWIALPVLLAAVITSRILGRQARELKKAFSLTSSQEGSVRQ
jgi:hypothetical protein